MKENKLKELQHLLTVKNLNGFIFSTSDEYLNEYVPEYNNRLKLVSNFTGSFGVIIVLEKEACLFVDPRYTIAAQQQVDSKLIEVALFSKTNISKWLKSKLNNNKVNIGINSRITSYNEILFYQSILSSLSYELSIIDYHLVDEIWSDRPQKPFTEIYHHSLIHGSISHLDKINLISQDLKQNNINAFLITGLDNIAWLLNIRGHDIPCNPLCLSKLIISDQGIVSWFVNSNKTNKIRSQLGDVDFYEEEDLNDYLHNLFKSTQNIGISSQSPYYYFNLLNKIGFKVINTTDFCTIRKAIKNDNEINSITQAHVRDGAYITKLYYDILNNPLEYDEVSIDKKLTDIKKQDSLFIEPSFPSIIGIDDHGAIIHYRATKHTSKKLTENSKILIDCGSQYFDGTTDVTRTFAIGNVSDDFKKHYTIVLKSHISVATAIFKEGTIGSEVDFLARQPLWQYGMDYGHGTGHGVGFFLCVHEGPQRLSPADKTSIKEGMIFSNEPGYYVENKYGIRLENLYVVKKSEYEGFLCFENFTIAPFDLKSIDFNLLDKKEISWLENYHKEVLLKLSPLLNDKEREWLNHFININ